MCEGYFRFRDSPYSIYEHSPQQKTALISRTAFTQKNITYFTYFNIGLANAFVVLRKIQTHFLSLLRYPQRNHKVSKLIQAYSSKE